MISETECLPKLRLYGIPYKGSKNNIAEWVYKHFPKQTNFYDLFAGGCAITQIALMKGHFQRYFANDLDFDGITIFMEAIHGRFRNETRWISREDFKALYEKDPYVKYCWSFGNRGFQYLYSKEVEPWKKALHYARLFNDFSLLHEIGIETKNASRIWIKAHSEECKEKYIKWYCKTVLESNYDTEKLRLCLTKKIKENSENLRNYLLEGLKKANKRPCDVDKFLGTNGMAGHYFGCSQWEFPTREVYEKLQGFLYLPQSYNDIYGLQELCESLESLQCLESLQRLQSLESLQSLQCLESLSVSNKSYDEVEILPHSVLYCDIPYYNTDEYAAGGFDHQKFYKWALRQNELVVISEYYMPDDFMCIDAIEKSVKLCSGGDVKALEKLFIPRKQAELYKKLLNKKR